ncbi:MAG TPA: hypothetical protein VMW24_01615 [Sedimentisphaerales bacterium]|nr:hypothetical protein [Sedimentisphaerales bacterium]
MSVMKTLITRAAPTCRLWVQDWTADVLRFRLWPKWYITHQELIEGR